MLGRNGTMSGDFLARLVSKSPNRDTGSHWTSDCVSLKQKIDTAVEKDRHDYVPSIVLTEGHCISLNENQGQRISSYSNKSFE